MQIQHWCLIVFVTLAGAQWPLSAGAGQQPVTGQPAQPQEQPPATRVTINPNDLPVSLDRIQRALANTPMLRFDDFDRPVFRVQVFGERPTIDDILGPDWAIGPVRHGSMTHQEFLALARPGCRDSFGTALGNRHGWRPCPGPGHGAGIVHNPILRVTVAVIIVARRLPRPGYAVRPARHAARRPW
jgi:hypothetical protein